MDAYLQRACDEVATATAHLTVEQIAREIPGKWSVALILEHLTLTFRFNVSALEKAMAKNETMARKPTFYQWLTRVLVLDVGYFPCARAPEAVVPSGSIPPGQVRAAIAETLVTLDTTLTRAAEHFGQPAPLLKHRFFAAMTVPQWRKFRWRHVRHHMRQVRERSAS